MSAVPAAVVVAALAGCGAEPPAPVAAPPVAAPPVSVAAAPAFRVVVDGARTDAASVRAAPARSAAVVVTLPAGSAFDVTCGQAGGAARSSRGATMTSTIWLRTPDQRWVAAVEVRLESGTQVPDCRPGAPSVSVVAERVAAAPTTRRPAPTTRRAAPTTRKPTVQPEPEPVAKPAPPREEDQESAGNAGSAGGSYYGHGITVDPPDDDHEQSAGNAGSSG